MKKIVLTLTVAAMLAGCGSAKAADFTSSSSRVNNPWFPLKPGTTYLYKGVKDGKRSRDVVTVTRHTRFVHGVRCVAVRDLLYLGDHLGERTTDWYAQDKVGNVWYFGEATAELKAHGRIKSTEGSWLAGRDGAKAGIYMPAHPRVGQSGRQEYYRGHAEDHFKVLSRRARLLTKEWTPLEPGVVDHKLYVRGIGTVREQTVKGGDERNVLVTVRGS
jgi:hypothetical protein